MMNSRLVCLLGCLVIASLPAFAQASEDELCPLPRSGYQITDNFFFSASSDQGAVGDVVGIDVSLTVEPWIPHDLIGFQAILCFDGDKVELVGSPVFTEYYDVLAYMTLMANEVGGENPGPRHVQGENGFQLAAAVGKEVAQDLLAGGAAVPLLTLFFRLKGVSGDAAEIRFCDGEFTITPQGTQGCSCVRNQLMYLHSPQQHPPNFTALSTRHEPGLVRILPGEATRTEIPDLQPSAKVYPEVPTAEGTEIRFELTGALTHPGAREVPMDLFITSSHEFTSYSLSLTFPPELVAIARVEEAVRPGAVTMDNDAGTLGLMLQHATRRIGREGERVQIATLYVNISETAQAEEIPFRFEDAAHYMQWVGIRHSRGLGADQLPIITEVTPIQVQAEALALQLRATAPGDTNLDYAVDLSDAIAILGHLFLGQDALLCPPAADVNDDGRVNLSDPIDLLGQLFTGGSPIDMREVFCDGGA